MTEYRITYVIQRRRDDEEDFSEIGFGTSGAGARLEDCAADIEAMVPRGEWETEAHHPDPEEVLRDIWAEEWGEES